MGVGSTQVSIAAGGLTATTQTVTITPATLASLTITPQTPVFADNTTQQFTVIGTFSDGTQQDLSTQAIWTSSNPQVLTIDKNGLATGGTPGSAQVSVTFNGITATTGSVQVTSATLATLTLTPTTARIAKGTVNSSPSPAPSPMAPPRTSHPTPPGQVRTVPSSPSMLRVSQPARA